MTYPTNNLYRFPSGFLWGAATSSHQVEGNNIHNDWWEWEAKGKSSGKSGDACRHYEFFDRDFDQARSLNHKAHRFSIEWSRIEPRRGEWNQQEIKHYRLVVKSLREQGLEPFVTLHHFTNPLWISEQGGWVHPETAERFVLYVEKVMEQLGGEVKYWLTINEPLVYAYQGYVGGQWPPGRKNDIEKGLKVIRNFLSAHALAYQSIHRIAKEKGWPAPQVSFAHSMYVFSPCHAFSPGDFFSAVWRHRFYNLMALEAALSGTLTFPGIFNERLPHKGCLDFIGINYYSRNFVHFGGWDPLGLIGTLCGTHHRDPANENSLGWEIYPDGIRRLLKELKGYHLPVVITENGICTEDDSVRERFIVSHIRSIAKAMSEGVKVAGYLYWSLLDNFEWAEGFKPRFGLIEVDFKSQQRKIRHSARVFSDICRKNAVEMT